MEYNIMHINIIIITLYYIYAGTKAANLDKF